jgi:hypothetical protein
MEGWREGRGPSERDERMGRALAGIALIVLGLGFLASQWLNLDLGRYGWPLYVIVPGLFLLVLGLLIPHEGGLGAAIPGGIIATVGLLLAFQEATGAYGSWSYAWALVAPGSVGVSLFAWGLLHGRLDLVDAGLRTAAVGLGLFVGFGLFFENVIGVDREKGVPVLADAMPVLAIALGAIIVLINLLPRHGSDGGGSGAA